MKSLIQAVAFVVVLAAPVASFAQIEQAGYNPAASSDSTYPADIQAAEARVAAQNSTTGYGPATAGTSETGSNVPAGNPYLQAPMGGQ
ncbi:MAG TPA: hypothetical protein VF534_21205 [Paraburkholderia sp.]